MAPNLGFKVTKPAAKTAAKIKRTITSLPQRSSMRRAIRESLRDAHSGVYVAAALIPTTPSTPGAVTTSTETPLPTKESRSSALTSPASSSCSSSSPQSTSSTWPPSTPGSDVSTFDSSEAGTDTEANTPTSPTFAISAPVTPVTRRKQRRKPNLSLDLGSASKISLSTKNESEDADADADANANGIPTPRKGWYRVKGIIHESRTAGGTKLIYLVEWEGRDPKTGAPWPAQWVNAKDVSASAIRHWEAKKEEMEMKMR